jgi:hypothetical protein
LFGASTEVVAEVREEEKIVAVDVPSTRHGELVLRGIQAERAVAAWLIESGFRVTPAPVQSGYDYLVEGSAGTFAIDVLYARNDATTALLMRKRQERYHEMHLEVPLTIVVVANTPGSLEKAEQLWMRLDPPYRLCTGLLTPDGRFQVMKPL